MIFVLSDQNFPPVIHCEKEKNCPKMLRVENGLIGKIVRAFVESTLIGLIPPGSVILCGSVTHLTDVGMASSARDFVTAGRKFF
jgi:hypothetical protein